MNRKKYLIALSAIMMVILLFLISGGRVIPPMMVDYYGQLITDEQLTLTSPEASCVSLPKDPLEEWYVRWTYQASLICVDTSDERDRWFLANQADQ